jgi:hypothetical protein
MLMSTLLHFIHFDLCVCERASGLQKQLTLTASDKMNKWVEAMKTPSCD